MKHQRGCQKGFGLLEIVIALAVVAVLAGGGWYVAGLQKQRSMLDVGLTAEQQAQQAADLIAFPVPALYGGYDWKLASTSYKAIYISGTKNSIISLAGQLYEATNTDPAALAWQKMDATAPKDQPEGFYSGDQEFLSYYEDALQATGYQTQVLNLDQNFNIINSGKATSVLGPLSADGPHGTIGGYIKYSNGRIRVVITASSDAKNQVFVSDAVKVKDAIVPSEGIEPPSRP